MCLGWWKGERVKGYGGGVVLGFVFSCCLNWVWLASRREAGFRDWWTWTDEHGFTEVRNVCSIINKVCYQDKVITQMNGILDRKSCKPGRAKTLGTSVQIMAELKMVIKWGCKSWNWFRVHCLISVLIADLMLFYVNHFSCSQSLFHSALLTVQ